MQRSIDWHRWSPGQTNLFAPCDNRISDSRRYRGAAAAVARGSQAVTLKTFTISAGMRGHRVVDDTDFTPDELAEILDTAARLKRMHSEASRTVIWPQDPGNDFPAPSTRTRVSFEAGMTQLGGRALYLGMNDPQLRRGETVSDTAKVISRYCDVHFGPGGESR